MRKPEPGRNRDLEVEEEKGGVVPIPGAHAPFFEKKNLLRTSVSYSGILLLSLQSTVLPIT